MRIQPLLVAAIAVSTPAMAQSIGNCATRVAVGSPTTDAGDGGPAVKAQLFSPSGVAKDPAGNLYIADTGNNKVRVVRTDGTIQTVAGTGIRGGLGDGGPAISAQLNSPVAVAIGPEGDLYTAESSGNRVRKISSDGVIHTVAGTGQSGFGGDGGPAALARFTNPSAIAFDASGNLYIADRDNYRVRRVAKDGTVSTFAGTGYLAGRPIDTDGTPAGKTYIDPPVALVFGADGTLYIGTDLIKSVTPDGLMHTVAGVFYNGKPPAEGVPALQANLAISDLAIDPQGTLMFADAARGTVWKIGSDGNLHSVVYTYIGQGLLLAPDGSITRSNPTLDTVVKYIPGPLSGNVSPNVVVAGVWPRSVSGDGGPGTQASLLGPAGVATDSAGNVVITDAWAGQIRKLDTKGVITTIAGTGGPTSTPDGLPALQSVLSFPGAIAISRTGEIFYSEQFNHRVRKIQTDGKVTTVAGNGSYPLYYTRFDNRDGSKATAVALNADSLALDANGNLYIADSYSRVIWRVATDGILHLVAQYNGIASSGVNDRPRSTDPSGAVYYLEPAGPYTLNLVRIRNDFKTEIVRNLGNFFSEPNLFAIDGAGTVYLADHASPTFHKSASGGSVSALINTTVPPPSLFFSAAVLDSAGNLFAVDATQARVMEISAATSCTASQLPLIALQGAVNAADYRPSEVAPGEIVNLFGILVGPSTLTKGTVDSSGKVTTSVGGTQVLFDGIPTPVLYASSGQTASIVPFGVAGQEWTNVQVLMNGFLSNTVRMYITDLQPGIFTQDASGTGPGAILNQDYSLNSTAHPAKKGSVVMVYMTGLGLVNPPVADGAIIGSSLSHVVQTVFAIVGGNSADVLYAGTAPELVAGANQVNVRIPAAAPSGSVPITIFVGPGQLPARTAANITVAVE
ncbi:MAG TPA: hypothetical protein VJN43_05730 [Bryobacteraceae bacterium]|nr:hypothetical protein [Bryobacteraceae bacterium]